MVDLHKIRGSRCDRHHSWSWTACTAVLGRLSAPKLFAKSPALSKQVWSEHIYTWKQHSHYNPTQGKWSQFFSPKNVSLIFIILDIKKWLFTIIKFKKSCPKIQIFDNIFFINIYENLLKAHIGFTLEHVNHVTLLGNLNLQKSQQWKRRQTK